MSRSSARIMLAALLSVFVIVPVVQAQWQPWVVRGLIGWAEREAARRAALAAAAEAAAGAEARALAIAAAERAAAQRAAVAAANAERLAVQRAAAAATAEREAARQAALAAVTAEGATTLRASASTWRSISMSPNRGLFGWRANALRAEQNAQMAITQSRLGAAAGAAQGTARGSMLMGQQTFLRRAASNMLPGRARDELGMTIYMAERRAAQAFTQGRALQTRRLFLQRQRLFSRMRQQRQLLARQAARQEATEIAALEERQAIRSGSGSRGGSSGGPGEPGGGGSGNGQGKPSLTETFNESSRMLNQRRIADLSEAAKRIDPADAGGRLTKAGRALQKHQAGAREGSGAFPKALGNPQAINSQGQKIVDEILNNKNSVVKFQNGRFGTHIHVISPDGRGLDYTPTGELNGFLEP